MTVTLVLKWLLGRTTMYLAIGFCRHGQRGLRITGADSAWMAPRLRAYLPRALDTGWLRQAVAG
jgi:transposase